FGSNDTEYQQKRQARIQRPSGLRQTGTISLRLTGRVGFVVSSASPSPCGGGQGGSRSTRLETSDSPSALRGGQGRGSRSTWLGTKRGSKFGLSGRRSFPGWPRASRHDTGRRSRGSSDRR